ncbi:MAG: hypothetical protein HQ581_00625 [Planctomycetes bacterium]|nr:hypothetical protein [Planctomycetota bacterium]
MKEALVLLGYIIVIAAAVAGRFGGSWLGRRLGARHAVAWFGALVGFASAAILFIAIMSRGSVVRELRDGRAYGCLVVGVFVATFIEFLAFVDPSRKRLAKPNNAPPRAQFSLRGLLTVVALISILLSAYRGIIVPHHRFVSTHKRIETSVDRLSNRSPAGVTPAKWDDSVWWAHEAVGCGLALPEYIQDMPRYHRFADELEERLDGEVDMATIDWIWDEYVAISVDGQDFAESHRPTGP